MKYLIKYFYILEKKRKDMQQFTNYQVLSWYEYQSTTPSHLQSIEHFHKTCQEKAKVYGDDVIVLCQNAIEIGPDINPFHRMYGDYYPMWLKILYKETIGWIKIDSDRINEYK